jgi:hypothetical protein
MHDTQFSVVLRGAQLHTYTAWVHGLNICVYVFGQDCVSVGVGVGGW